MIEHAPGRIKTLLVAIRDGKRADITAAAAREASGHLDDVLDVWEVELRRGVDVPVAIALALPNFYSCARPDLLARVTHLASGTIEAAPAGSDPEAICRLAGALLRSDMAVPNAHREVVKLVRAHRALLERELHAHHGYFEWASLAPLV